MRDKLQLKSQSLETTAPSVIRCQTTNIETQTSPQHGAGVSRFPFICTAETLLTFLKGYDDDLYVLPT